MKIRNLSIKLDKKDLLKNISFDIKMGRALMIVGQSGVGKSLLGKSLVRLLDSKFEIHADQLSFNQTSILDLSKKELRYFRSKVAFILQDAELSLYPYLNIKKLFHLVLKTHTKLHQRQYKAYTYNLLEKLGFDNIDLLWHCYANELSLGMARRISLALALLTRPKILICDEITASLDKQNAQKIIQILRDLKKDMALVCITHDLRLIHFLADEILLLEKDQSQVLTICEFLRLHHA